MATYPALETALATSAGGTSPAVKRLAAHWVATTGQDVGLGEGEVTPKKSFATTIAIMAVTIAVTAVTMTATLEEIIIATGSIIPTTVSMGTLREATIPAPIVVATTILLTANPMSDGA